ncbi:uncharacterized protein LOC131883287 [Tigriopus californicus]|uniref:uncharacterized protein LOC131883287 n=1 Tax=Tigriopus californicus TaxID=6832 RepID=UPI0027DA07E4|nr:uncharacterized protein LOC131883287 [Tigriopus californicus]|eukprot:TCALIF_00175-PA protein Name:"Protein of unknown function" AED:0.00 eAED:0.00 QI:120/1/1/1/0/0/3/27/195
MEQLSRLKDIEVNLIPSNNAKCPVTISAEEHNQQFEASLRIQPRQPLAFRERARVNSPEAIQKLKWTDEFLVEKTWKALEPDLENALHKKLISESDIKNLKKYHRTLAHAKNKRNSRARMASKKQHYEKKLISLDKKLQTERALLKKSNEFCQKYAASNPEMADLLWAKHRYSPTPQKEALDLSLSSSIPSHASD